MIFASVFKLDACHILNFFHGLKFGIRKWQYGGAADFQCSIMDSHYKIHPKITKKTIFHRIFLNVNRQPTWGNILRIL